ncbi:hypothetical protein BH23PLA1_BH23PLA1_04600 [soil metagenome]
MMYTNAHPSRQGDRIRLFPSRQAAEAALGDPESVIPVAVGVDSMGRRLFPTWICPEAFDPAWSTPAYMDADGSVTARAPIPRPLFVSCPMARDAVVEAMLCN